MACNDWVISTDTTRRIYSKDPENRESLTGVECINGTGKDIPPVLILTGLRLLAPSFKNNLSDDVFITISDSGYSNDWIALEWVKHFDRYSAKHQKMGLEIVDHGWIWISSYA